ncbi:MAG: ABC transporter permease [Clostridia bacterium]|nr:ABC transporter permease [Clostridia bacterium]
MGANLAGAIALGTVLLLGSVGEIITEKSGHLNLGIPGIMCMGAVGGCWGMVVYANLLANPASANWFLLLFLAVTCSMIFGALGAAIYSFLTVSLRANQNVTGLALTIFGTGFSLFFVKQYIGKGNAESVLPALSKILNTSLPFAGDLGFFGQVFLSFGIIVYLAVLIALFAAFTLRKTRVGLRLRAIGESPATADAVGINVLLYKYSASLIGGAVAGLGGLIYIVVCRGGNGLFEVPTDLPRFGWLAIALVIFTVWKPDVAILGSILFGLLYMLKDMGIPFNSYILKLVPYLVTIIVLIFTSIFGSKAVQPPASLGLNYFREDR